MVVFGQKWFYSGKVIVFGQKCLYLGKIVVKGLKWFNSGKSGCIWARRINSAIVVVFVQICCFRAMCLSSGKNCCIGAKRVVLGQKWL